MGVARELARAVMPVGAYTEFYWTVNARALMNFVSLRAAETAQREIRRYADAVEQLFAERMPVTYEAFVAADQNCSLGLSGEEPGRVRPFAGDHPRVVLGEVVARGQVDGRAAADVEGPAGARVLAVLREPEDVVVVALEVREARRRRCASSSCRSRRLAGRARSWPRRRARSSPVSSARTRGRRSRGRASGRRRRRAPRAVAASATATKTPAARPDRPGSSRCARRRA